MVRTQRDPGSAYVSAIVLAAGRSQRMGAANKLLLPVEGMAVVRRVVEALSGAPVDEVLVVVGHEAEAVAAALRGVPARLVENPRYDEGLSSSLVAGVAAADPEADGYLVCVGDLPRLPTSAVRAVVDRFRGEDQPPVVVPHFKGRPGHPVAIRRQFREALLALEGDRGARAALLGLTDLTPLDVPDPGVLLDIDTPGDYDRHG